MLTYIVWDVRPEVFSWSDIPRWYGIFWAMGVFLSISVSQYIFKTEKREPGEIEDLTLYLVIGTLIGARLGHILFYDLTKAAQDRMEEKRRRTKKEKKG